MHRAAFLYFNNTVLHGLESADTWETLFLTHSFSLRGFCIIFSSFNPDISAVKEVIQCQYERFTENREIREFLGKKLSLLVEVIEIQIIILFKQLTLKCLIKHIVDHQHVWIWRITDCLMNIFYYVKPQYIMSMWTSGIAMLLYLTSSLPSWPPSLCSEATQWTPNKLDL